MLNDLAMKALEPLMLTVVGALSAWVLAWLKKFIETKTGIAITDAQFEAAKKAVQVVEEQALSGVFLGTGQAKTAKAVELVQAALPKLTTDRATTLVNQAVAVVPTVGATSQCKWQVIPDDPSIPKVLTP